MQTPTLPHNDYAEMIAIGCLLEGYQPEHILAELVPDDFYGAANRVIFAAARDLAATSAPVGMFTVVDRLRTDGNIDKVGGVDYLMRCAGQVVSHTQAEGAVWGVRDAALLRKGYMATVSAARELSTPGRNATELIGGLQTELLKITARDREQTTATAKEVMTATVADIEASRGRGEISGVATGFRLLDYWTGGLQRGELIILAARPSMGKTSLMMDIVRHATLIGTHAYVFSLEMAARQLGLRLVCAEAMIDSHKVRTGRIDDGERSRLAQAAAKLSACKLHVNDSANDLSEIVAAVKREREYTPIGLICIDYLGLIYNRHLRAENRNIEIGMMTRQLKALAKEIDVPVLCLSQLSRVNEAAKDKRPTLNALRESGNIEQDADTVLFIHSDDYYDREAEAGAQRTEWRSDLIIAKQRNGPTEDVPLLFRRQYTRFFPVDTVRTPVQQEAPGWYQK
ncbi:MAG TPA: replicative DNA helicase [bacterium]|nr:replicative DNA helicase [bacterium]